MDSNTELAAELKAAIDYTAEKCANAPYVPVKAETAQAILIALTQPAEQIADGAVEVSQRDREAAARLNGYASWRVWEAAPQHDEEWMLLCANDFARHAQQARAQALEEAAKVAEGGFKNRTTRIRIATAIRALNGQGGGV